MSLTPTPGCGVAHLWRPTGLVAHADVAPHEIRTLTHTGVPGPGLPAEPWALVAVDTDGTVAATASPAFAAGLFWASTATELLFADTVRALVDALAPHVSLDPQFIREFAVIPRTTAATSTAFREIHRIQPGTTLVWPTFGPPTPDPTTADGAGSTANRNQPGTEHVVRVAMRPAGEVRTPRVVQWCGPHAWGEATLEGPGTEQLYVETFDRAVDELLTDGPLYTHLSGGLDSTFVAASLLRHATPDNPVHALCHSPLPEADLTSRGNWDPDDYPVAKAMEAAYPGRLIIHRVFAEPDEQPLDAAAAAAEVSGVPTFNPANQSWIKKTAAIAAAGGASVLFSGQNGNATYSYHHNYAPGFYLGSGHPLLAWRSIDPDARRMPSRAALRQRAIMPLRARVRAGLPEEALTWWRNNSWRTRGARRSGAVAVAVGDAGYPSLVGLGHIGEPSTPALNREGYLHWLNGDTPLSAARMFRASAVPVVDPFATRSMLDLAAAISPLEWSRGPGARGYARLLAACRVPDSIRLRTRRGGQSWDEWYLIRNQRERYYDEVAALATTPILGGWVDDAVLRSHLDAWPWGQVHGPSQLPVLAMARILSLAAYVRAATRWSRG